MNSNDYSLATLQECKRALDRFTTVLDANQKLINYYNNIELVEYKTYSDDYDTRKQNSANNLIDWQQRYDNEKNSYLTVRVNGDCAAAGICSQSTCPSGYTDDGRISGWQANCDIWGVKTGCAKSCQPDYENVTNHMNNWKNSNPTPTFTEIKKESPTTPGLNTTPIQINCCANVSTVLGSTVTNTQITQINKCSQEVNNKLSEPTPDPTQETTPAPTQETTQTPTQGTQDKQKNIIIVLIILAIFLYFFQVFQVYF